MYVFKSDGNKHVCACVCVCVSPSHILINPYFIPYVDPDDSKALAGAIAELISNPTLRASKIAAGAKHIEQFRAEKIADKLDAIYSSLLNNSCQ